MKGKTALLLAAVIFVCLCALTAFTVSELEQRQSITPTTSAATSKIDVKSAQERLQALGYQPGAADGQMGVKATAALKKFQSDRALPPTGTLDRKTLDALGVKSLPQPISSAKSGMSLESIAFYIVAITVGGGLIIVSGINMLYFWLNILQIQPSPVVCPKCSNALSLSKVNCSNCHSLGSIRRRVKRPFIHLPRPAYVSSLFGQVTVHVEVHAEEKGTLLVHFWCRKCKSDSRVNCPKCGTSLYGLLLPKI